MTSLKSTSLTCSNCVYTQVCNTHPDFKKTLNAMSCALRFDDLELGLDIK